MSKKVLALGGGSSFSLLLLFSAIAYFVYGTLDGAIAIFIYDAVISLASYLGFVPFVGWLLYWFVASAVTTFVLDLTGIGVTWLTSLIFWIGFVFSFIFCAITTIIALAWLNIKIEIT